jgi:hypothetical protein
MAGDLSNNGQGLQFNLNEIQQYRTDLAKRAGEFNLAQPTSESEFDVALDWLFNHLMFDNKNWQNTLIHDPQLRRELPVLDSFPLLCKTSKCRYYEVCPIMKSMPKGDQNALKDSRCRMDRTEGVKIFTATIKELNVQPDSMTEIIQVARLVRLLVLQRRVDWELAINDISYEEVSAVVPAGEGEPWIKIYEKRVNQLMKEGERIEGQINKIYSQLLATRKDRAHVAVAGREKDNALKNLLMDALRTVEKDESTPAEWKDVEEDD